MTPSPPLAAGQRIAGAGPGRPPARRGWFAGTLLFVLAVLVVMNGALWWLYRRFSTDLDIQLGQRLQAVAVTAAEAVGHGYAPSAPPDTGLVGYLDRVLAANDLSNIALIRPDERTIVDLRGLSQAGERNPTLDLYLVPLTAALAGAPGASAQYRVGEAYLKSAFAPVLDDSGRVTAALAVEAGTSLFDSVRDIRRSLLLASGLSLLGVIGLALGFMSAVARQARLEASLQRADNMATMGQMAAMLAHEIRNPLGIIKGAAERLRDRYRLADDELYRFIPEEVDRLNAILGNYLRFAREESDASGVFTPAELLGRTRDLLEPQLTGGGHRLRLELDADSGRAFRGDGARLRQALLNLALNAAEATPGGGEIVLRAARFGGRLHLAVVDDGPGIPAEVRARLGEPFFTTKEKGSGLGLSIVRRVAESHGGRLMVDSRPGGGSTFTLELPAHPAAGALPQDGE